MKPKPIRIPSCISWGVHRQAGGFVAVVFFGENRLTMPYPPTTKRDARFLARKAAAKYRALAGEPK